MKLDTSVSHFPTPESYALAGKFSDATSPSQSRRAPIPGRGLRPAYSRRTGCYSYDSPRRNTISPHNPAYIGVSFPLDHLRHSPSTHICPRRPPLPNHFRVHKIRNHQPRISAHNLKPLNGEHFVVLDHQHVQRGLACAVMGEIWPSPTAVIRRVRIRSVRKRTSTGADEDDARSCRFAQQREESLGDEDRADRIRGEHGAETDVWWVGALFEDAGVVDQNIEAAVGSGDGFGGRSDGVFGGYVYLDGFDGALETWKALQSSEGLGTLRPGAAAQEDVVAWRGEQEVFRAFVAHALVCSWIGRELLEIDAWGEKRGGKIWHTSDENDRLIGGGHGRLVLFWLFILDFTVRMSGDLK